MFLCDLKGVFLSPSLLGMSRLGFIEAAGLGTRFAPTGEVAVHDGIKGGTVVGHEQMGELVDDDVFNAPAGQQQEVERKGDAACAVVAGTPSGDGFAEGDGCWLYAHLVGMSLQQWGNDSLQALGSVASLGRGVEWQLGIEVVALLLAIGDFLAGCFHPLAVLLDECFHLTFRHADGGRNAHVAILCNTHGKVTCTAIGDDDGHYPRNCRV